jgi:UDP-N-acetylmuramoylalanine--D-glutamate ligase
MKRQFDSVYVVGNIGTSYTSMVDRFDEETVAVAEISSFQLETIDTFHPLVTAVLNITPDHLNRHYTMENYTNVKMSITKNQTADEICVLNYEDPILKEEARKLNNKVLFFSSKQTLEYGIYLQNEKIVYAENGTVTPICGVNDMKLVGIHNVENVMAAIGMALTMQVPIDVIREAIAEFNAVEHRIEYVTTKQGVIYYNDSKGTNTDASIKAIEAMTRPTVLIAGGYDKGSEFDEWFDAFGGRVKHLLLLGATREKIAKTAIAHRYDNYTFVESLEEAVKTAAAITKDGDAVLLSPACASWDMFKSYEERGTLFKNYVNAL